MVKVLLTGASGFIATHVFQILLERDYEIVATVRSQDKADWIDKQFGDKKSKYTIEFVKDISADGSFDETLKKHTDVKYVMHTASPFYQPKADPENSILKPAIQGTTNILKAIKAYAPQVEHVVVTSSFAAIVDPNVKGNGMDDPNLTYSEKSWSPITYEQAASNLSLTYRGSKTLAEKALWNFIKEENVNFTGTAINPPIVFGPILQEVKSSEALNTSSSVLYQLLTSKPGDKVANLVCPEVDVRDTALAHVLAIEKKEAVGQRWFVTPGYFSSYEALRVINKHFPQYKVAAVPSGYDCEKEFATKCKINNDLTNEQSGIKYRSLEQTLVDTFNSLIEESKRW